MNDELRNILHVKIVQKLEHFLWVGFSTDVRQQCGEQRKVGQVHVKAMD